MATILVVDDRAPDRELLSTLLRHGRHRVLEAADGAEALRLLRAEHPDLVISDVLLPKMDGYELVRQMQLDPAISETTVIFYTAAFNEQEARDLARECGVTLILSKPTDPKTILEKVAEVLNAKGVKGITSLPASFEQRHQELLVDKLMLQVEALHRNEEALRRSHEELELRVEERTADLRRTVTQLQGEVVERQRAEESLRESRERLRFITSQLLHVQEMERKRVSLELHEELGQSLTALKLRVRGVEKDLPPGGMKEELGHSLDYINEIIENVRCLSQDLRPSILEHMGIEAALRYLIDEFSKYNQIPVTLEMDAIQGLFAAEAEVIIYRIFQESFANIARHAQAGIVSVFIKRQDGQVNFRVEDNGRGFDSQEMLNGDITKWGLGLSAMAERMRMLNGRLDVWSREGQGTRIAFAVPVMTPLPGQVNGTGQNESVAG